MTRRLVFLSALLVSTMLTSAASAAALLDPAKTTLPAYLLPDSAKADGDLAEWNGVPAVAAESFKPANSDAAITPSESFAPTLRLGMKKGSDDLFLLVIVGDTQRYYEAKSIPWNTGDFLELYMDFGREARDKQFPGWQTPDGMKKFNAGKQWTGADMPGMGQCGFRPATLAIQPQAIYAYSAGKWKFDYACVPVEGGLAYEIRIDAQSVLGFLKLNEMPACLGFDLGFCDQDYPIVLRTEGWTNEGGLYRLFGDGMDHAFVTKFGMASLRPIALPDDRQTPNPPKTLKAAFGEFPSADDVRKAIGQLPGGRLADLVYWAGCQGAAFDEALVKALMADASPLVRENCLAVLYYTEQDKAAIKAALDAAYKDAQSQQPNVLLLANLLNEKLVLGYAPQLRELARSADYTVAFSAARALARVGTMGDVAPLQQALADAKAAIEKRKDLPMGSTGHLRAYDVFMGGPLEELRSRVEPITIPAATPVVERKAENADLPRLMPMDGNHVYSAKGLLRSWPAGGPKELWRSRIGEGKAAVVEVCGKAFTAAQADGKQWALCLDPLTGKTLWRHAIYEKEWKHIANGPIVTPVVDDDRVYFVPKFDTGYNPVCPIVCLKFDDGSEVWRSDDASCYAQADASPLIVGDTFYVPAGRQGQGQILVALDKKTGKLLWSVKDPAGRKDVYGSSASPVYQIIDGIPQVIFGVYYGARELWGVNAKTGEVYWTYPTPLHHSLLASPVAVGSRVFTCGGQGAAAFSACLQMYVKDGKIKARQVYRSESLQCNMYNTVAVLDAAVYGFSGDFIHCTNLDDGKLFWKKAAKEWDCDRQLIIADGLVFALTNKDELVMLEASKAGCKERGRVPVNIKLGIPQQPTIANGRLYIRGDEWVVCYDLVNAR